MSSVSLAWVLCGLVLACPTLAAEVERRPISTPDETNESAPERRDEAADREDDSRGSFFEPPEPPSERERLESALDELPLTRGQKEPPSSRRASLPAPKFRGPDVTLIAGEERTIYEYRHNGQLRMIKVVPKFGKPYYLAPRDPTRGFGDLEQADTLIAEWVLWEF